MVNKTTYHSKTLLFISQDLVESKHHRGIYTYSKNLLKILNDLEYKIYLATDRYDSKIVNKKLLSQFYYLKNNIQASAFANYLHDPKLGRLSSVRHGGLRAYFINLKQLLLCIKLFCLKLIPYKVKIIPLDNDLMEHFTDRSDFVPFLAGVAVIPDLYVSAKFFGYFGYGGRTLCADDFDLVVIDAPININVKQKNGNIFQVIHDLIPFNDPTLNRRSRNVFMSSVLNIINKYKNLLFVSEFTKNFYHKMFLSNNIAWIVFYPRIKLLSMNEVRDLKENFVLLIISQDYRKNTKSAIEAAPLFHKGIKLYIVGECDLREYQSLIKTANSVEKGKIVEFGFISEAHKQLLIRQARCVLVPALAEGFGLPISESLLCGTKVACSDIPVFHEVAGKYGNFFDPLNPASIAATVNSIQRPTKLEQKEMIDWAQKYNVDGDVTDLMNFLDRKCPTQK